MKKWPSPVLCILSALVSLLILTEGPRIWAQAGAKHHNPSAESQIRALLDAQVVAWNRGDVEDFMVSYWNSEKTTFLSPSGVSRGWQALLDRYKRGYPDKKAMGTLAFSELEINRLGRDAAFVIGRWQLAREKDGQPDRPGGVFTLVLKKFPEGWRIVSDHTSSFPM
jgi:beta-aspartyl-peptidase (threonine type)